MDVKQITAKIMDAVMEGSVFTISGQELLRREIEGILRDEIDGSLFPSTESPGQQ